MTETTKKKARQGSAYGKLIDRVVYPANVFHWPVRLAKAGIWVGKIIGSRLEPHESGKRPIVTLECFAGVIYDGFPAEELLLVAEHDEPFIYGPDSFLVKPEHGRSNLRRVVQDRRPETRAGATRLAIVDRGSLCEIEAPKDLPLPLGPCPRCDFKSMVAVPGSPAIQCECCKTFYGPGSGPRNVALPMRGD